jgi:crotonobetainyl-CoA:carnitine CoA-transferase CaiB-like acyl-CoA transferase
MNTDHIFAGLKVVDLASFLAGPGAATVLSDFGADVIKVEPPGIGDPHRFTYKIPPLPSAKENYGWQLSNRNKRGLALDLKSPRSSEILERLVKWADVLVVNFPHPVRKKLKLTYEDIARWNPRLIYADLTGYGDEGPDADLPGFDITAYWSRSGLLDMTRDAGAPPTLPVPASGDHAAAMGLYSAIVTGLYRRERTGEGCYVTTSLIAEGIWASAVAVQAALCDARFYPLHDRKNPPNAIFNVYQTSDGRWFLIVMQPKDWPALVAAVGQPELASDPRFADDAARAKNSAQLAAILDKIFAAAPLAHWHDAFERARVTYGIVKTAAEVTTDPQTLANDIIVPIEGGSGHMTRTVSSPIRIHGVPKAAARRAPELGEHNDEILKELGFTNNEIDGFRAGGSVPQPAQQLTAGGVR